LSKCGFKSQVATGLDRINIACNNLNVINVLMAKDLNQLFNKLAALNFEITNIYSNSNSGASC
jgi:hypothetical protein